MDYMENNSVRRSVKKLKGFTLLELIVCMAIIGILAMMATLVIPGFVTDARIETNDQKARACYEAFQTLLIEAEITQDDSMFRMWDRDGTEHGDLVNCVIYFEIAQKDRDGTVNSGLSFGDSIDIYNYYKSPKAGESNICYYEPSFATGNTARGMIKEDSNGYDEADILRKNELFKRYEKEILGNLSSSAEGRYQVCINYRDYTIDSVLYQELDADGIPRTVDFMTPDLKTYNPEGFTYKRSTAMGSGALFDYMYSSMDNVSEHRQLERRTAKFYGIYPYEDDKS